MRQPHAFSRKRPAVPRHRLPRPSLALAALLAAPGYGLAEEPTLPEVVVQAPAAHGALAPAFAGGQVATATQLGVLGQTPVQDAPFNTSSYTAQTLEDTQTRSVLETLARVDPSVRLEYGDGASADALMVRGFPVANDELSLNGLPGITSQFRVSPEFVERAEVLKGPAVLLNGMSPGGAVGGAVNLVSKRAGDEPLTRINTGFSSDSLWGANADMGRRCGVDNAWGLRLNAGLRQGDTARDWLSEQSRMAALGLDFRSSRLRASLDLIHQRQNSHGIGSSLNMSAVGGPVPSAPDGSASFVQAWNTQQSTDDAIMGQAEWDLTDQLTLFGAIGHARNTRSTLIDQAPYANAQGDYAYYGIPTQWRQTTRSAQAGIKGRFATGPVQHQWSFSASQMRRHSISEFGLTALDGNRGYANIYHPVTVPPPTATAVDPLGPYVWNVRVELPSYAVVDTMAFAQNTVLLSLGLRRQTVKTDTFTGYPQFGQGGTLYRQSVTSPMAAIVVKASSQLSLYANHIQGLSAGAMAPVGTANQGESYAPYRTRQYEVGAKYHWGRFGTSLSLFQISKPYGSIDPASNRFGVNGLQRHRGLELNIYGEAARGLRLLGGALLMNPKVLDSTTGQNHGLRPVGATRRQFNLGAEWDLPSAPGWTVLARASHTGDSYADANNLARVPSWTVYDLGLRYATRWGNTPVTLRATLDNAFNKHYWKQGQYTATLGMPRTVAASASFEF